MPALVTDSTPWSGLNSTGAGWCVPWPEFNAALRAATSEGVDSLRRRVRDERCEMGATGILMGNTGTRAVGLLFLAAGRRCGTPQVKPGSSMPRPAALEPAVAAHLALFVIGVSWAFGGNADWVRTPISVWGSLGILLTIAAVTTCWRRDGRIPRELFWAWPVIALNGIVLVSCLTPGFQALAYPNGSLMMPVRVNWWVPSVTRTGLALHALWLFDGIYFSCLNLVLVVARRKTIRIVLAAVVANAVALSVFGTVQKLVGATGIYFGSVRSPQDYFFASFVYDNHWGAFIVLMIGACIGLVLRHARELPASRGVFPHGPAMAGLVAICLMGLTIPLSGARACTLLLGILVAVACVRGAPTVSRALRTSGIAPGGVFLAVAVAAILAGAGGWVVAGDSIQARASKTREQIAAIWAPSRTRFAGHSVQRHLADGKGANPLRVGNGKLSHRVQSV